MTSDFRTVDSSSGPLAGVTVIDFGQYIAGPGAAMIMADQGADVIRIERPGGPSMPSPANAVLNRGKRSIVLDLASAKDVEIARGLIADADILVENFRPGVMARLGVGPEQMRILNPGLIYLSLPGFSSDDTENADKRAWEGVVAASMGQFTDMGLNRVLMGIEASYSPLSLSSAYASVFGAMAVTLALRARATSGLGDHIEVPLAAALMEGLAYNSLWLENIPVRYKSLRERETERRRAAKLPMNLTYDQLQPLLDPFYRTYICRDGRPFYVVSGSHATHAQRALKTLGLWDEMVEAGLPLADPYLPIAEWGDGVDCTLKAYPITEPWAGRLTRRMAAVFLTKESAEWERLFGEAGAPAAAHRTTKEWLGSAHPREAGLLMEVEDSSHGKMLQPGPVAWLAGCPPVAGKGTTPARRNNRIPSGVGADARPWLEGIVILDMTNVIAGPTIAGTLARFGARVIKIDSVTPTYDPWNTIVFGVYSNRGKESVLVDVKSEKGRAVLSRLLKQVDIVTINCATKQLSSLGLDFAELQKINPRLILCHLDAFGGPRNGSRSEYPGYDDLVQASTGIMERFGGSMATVEEHAHFGTIDVLGGLCAALATSLALLRREKTGVGDVARSSLAAAGQWLQSRYMYDFDGRPPFDEPRGREAKGEGPFYRCYRAADRWFFFAMHPNAVSGLAASELIGKVLALKQADQEDWLEAIFKTKPVNFWQEHLGALNLAIQPLETMAAVRRKSVESGDLGRTVRFCRQEIHPSGHLVEHVEPTAVRPRRAPLVQSAPAEKYGNSTRRVMQDLGFSDAEVAEMLRSRVISESWSRDYLPD